MLEKHRGIRLDIGCGANKTPHFVGMDKRKLPGVDIVHDLERFPYPLADGCCLTIVGSHIVEHIKPWLMLDFMNELWRIARPGCQLALSMPYGVGHGFVQDPTHCNPCNETTFQYFCPEYPLYGIYQPRPWKMTRGFPVWQAHGNLEVLMEKINGR